MKKLLAFLILVFAGFTSAIAQNYNFNIGGLQYASGPSVPGACSRAGAYFFKNAATKGWYICNGLTYDAMATGGGGSAVWGAITGTLSNQTDLQTALNGKVALAPSADQTITGQHLLSLNASLGGALSLNLYNTGQDSQIEFDSSTGAQNAIFTSGNSFLMTAQNDLSLTTGTFIAISAGESASFFYPRNVAPAAPVIANVGATGTTHYIYTITLRTPLGTSVASEAQTVTGNAVLDGTNYNTVTVPASSIPGASFDIYGIAAGNVTTSGFITNVAPGATYNHQGAEGNGIGAPIVDTSDGFYSGSIATIHLTLGDAGSSFYVGTNAPFALVNNSSQVFFGPPESSFSSFAQNQFPNAEAIVTGNAGTGGVSLYVLGEGDDINPFFLTAIGNGALGMTLDTISTGANGAFGLNMALEAEGAGATGPLVGLTIESGGLGGGAAPSSVTAFHITDLSSLTSGTVTAIQIDGSPAVNLGGGTGTLGILNISGSHAPSGQHCALQIDDAGLVSTTGCS